LFFRLFTLSAEYFDFAIDPVVSRGYVHFSLTDI